MLDKDLEVEIYRVFIEENLLSLRDTWRRLLQRIKYGH